MSDQEVTYSSLRFPQSPSEPPNRLRPGSVQKPKKTANKGFSLPWHLVAVSFGIICLLLLMTVTVLGLKVFQHFQEKNQLEKILQNLSLKCNITKSDSSQEKPQLEEILQGLSLMCDIMQNDIPVKEKLLANKTLACDILKNKNLQQPNKLDSGFSEHIHKENLCHRKTYLSKTSENTDKVSSEFVSCCGEKCYYFSMESKNWNECKKNCENNSSSLLKINNKDELTFIQTQANGNQYWIGLSYIVSENKWKWIDNNTSGIDSRVKTLLPKTGHCAFVAATRLDATECSNKYHCICEERIRFP